MLGAGGRSAGGWLLQGKHLEARHGHRHPHPAPDPFWFGGIFMLALGCVLALAYGLARRWFQQAQQMRDSARSDWINGVSVVFWVAGGTPFR